MRLETEIKTKHGTIQPIKELKNKVFKFKNEQVVANFNSAMMFATHLGELDSLKNLETCIKRIEKHFDLDVSLIKNDRISLKKAPDTIIDKGKFFSVGYHHHHYCDLYITILGIGNWPSCGRKLYVKILRIEMKEPIVNCEEFINL